MSSICSGLNGLNDDIYVIADEDRARTGFELAQETMGPANGGNILEQDIADDNLEWPDDVAVGPSSSEMAVSFFVFFYLSRFCVFSLKFLCNGLVHQCLHYQFP